jgi:7-cyano-7-deazaguanine synthase
MPDKAVVLLSGGIDSATVLALAKNEGFKTYALTVDYGQTHNVELEAASEVARSLSAKEHKIIRVDLKGFGGSTLTGDEELRQCEEGTPLGEGIPATYVPARNTVFLALALSWAEAIGATDVFIGVTAIDYSGYPDCRPEYLEAFQKVADLGTKAGVEGKHIRIRAPLVSLSKSEIVKIGTQLGVEYSLTHSCYFPGQDGKACGKCDSCHFRKKAFVEAGLEDPTEYAE